MNTVENESSELRCLGRGGLRGWTPATSGCQVLFMLSKYMEVDTQRYLESLVLIYSVLTFCLELSKNIGVVRWFHIFVRSVRSTLKLQHWRYREFLDIKATNEGPRILWRLFSAFYKSHSFYSSWSRYMEHLAIVYSLILCFVAMMKADMVDSTYLTCWIASKALMHRSFFEKCIYSLKPKKLALYRKCQNLTNITRKIAV